MRGVTVAIFRTMLSAKDKHRTMRSDKNFHDQAGTSHRRQGTRFLHVYLGWDQWLALTGSFVAIKNIQKYYNLLLLSCLGLAPCIPALSLFIRDQVRHSNASPMTIILLYSRKYYNTSDCTSFDTGKSNFRFVSLRIFVTIFNYIDFSSDSPQGFSAKLEVVAAIALYLKGLLLISFSDHLVSWKCNSRRTGPELLGSPSYP